MIHGEVNPVEPSISIEELDSLRTKALDIYVLAHDSELANELPPEPNVDYETKLKLIGSLRGDRFYYTPKAIWFYGLRGLARRADDKQTKGKASNPIEPLLGKEGKEILAIIRTTQSADDKMRAICGIDRRLLAYNSLQWSELLDVSDAAIRKTKFWTKDRAIAIEANEP